MDVRELHRALVGLVRTWMQADADVRPVSYGLVIRDLRHPLVHDANLVWVDAVPPEGAEAILDDAERAFAGTPVPHRYVLFADPEAAYGVQEAFVSRGYRAGAELVMAKVGLPSCIVNPDVVVRAAGPETPIEDFRLVQAALHAEAGYTSEESRQVLSVAEARGRALGEHAFVGYLDEEPAGTYSLWPRGRFAVIRSVGTVPKFRMRGVGRTLMFDACRRATEAHCEYELLTTDLAATPQAMYKTLGFEPVGEMRGFLRR